MMHKEVLAYDKHMGTWEIRGRVSTRGQGVSRVAMGLLGDSDGRYTEKGYAYAGFRRDWA